MKKQSLNIITLFLLTILGFSSLFSQQKGGELLSENFDQPKGNTYAVVVGISDYEDPGISDLKYAHRDAQAFAGYLQSSAGGALDVDHLRLLVNEEATQAQFVTALDWLLEVANEGDKVIIYFSGHGDVMKKTITQPGYLLCWDTPSDLYMAGGFNVRDLKDIISTLCVQNKANVTLITDACRSGKLSGSKINGAQLTATNMMEQYANESKILSCQPHEYSIEGDQWGEGRGVFSYHMVNGLYGLADKDENGEVSMMELRNYLEENVPVEVEPYSQFPLTVGDARQVIGEVDQQLLADLKASKQGELELYSAIALRGIEDEILESVDTSVAKLYSAFEKALEDQRFLEPEGNCAETYYNQLLKIPELESLYSGMRRNYIAALIEEAQHNLNIYLKYGLNKSLTQNLRLSEITHNYPEHLQRAANLLGEDHYLYPDIMAQMHYFQTFNLKGDSLDLIEYRKALNYQPEAPYVYNAMIRKFDDYSEDSALYYASKAMELAPTWISPYIKLADYYRYDKNDLATVKYWLAEAEKLDSNSLRLSYYRAQFYYSIGDNSKANEYFLKTVNGTGEDICFPCAHNGLGLTYLKLEQHEKAEEQFRIVLADPRSELNPAYLYVNLAWSFFGRKEYERMLPLLDTAEMLDPDLSQAQHWKGNYYWVKKDYENALKYYLIAHQLDSTEELYINAIAQNYRDLDNNEEALKWYIKAIALNEENANYYYEAGIILFKYNRYQEAEEYFKKAYKIDSTSMENYRWLGAIYIRTRRPQLALPIFQKLISIDSTDAGFQTEYGATLANLGRFQEALYHTEKGILLDSSNQVGYGNAGIIHWNLGNLEKAELNFKKSIEVDSSYYTALFNLANFYSTFGRSADAARCFEQLSRKLPDNLNVKNNLIKAYIALEQFEEAELLLKDILIQHPNAAWAYSLYGNLYQKQKRYNEAEESFRTAIAFEPNNMAHYQTLGNFYRQQGKYKNCQAEYEEIIRQSPEDPYSYNSLADLMYIMGEYEEAEKQLSYGLQADSSVWILYFTWAQVKQAKGDYQGSIGLLNIANELVPTVPINRILKAIACAHLPDRKSESNEIIESIENKENLDVEASIFYTQWLAYMGEMEKAWTQLEKTLELNVNQEAFVYTLFNSLDDFKEMRADPKWEQLMAKK